MNTSRRATFAVGSLLGVLFLAPECWGSLAAAATEGGDQEPTPRAEGRAIVPSRAGDRPSSSGSGSGSGSGPNVTPPPSSGGGSSGSATEQQPDDRRGDARHSSGSRGGGSRGGRGRGGGHYGGYYGPWGYHPYGWNWAWWGYWPGYVYVDGPYSRRHGGESGALDLDLSPGRTQVWVDGNYVGTVDDFDGFPTFLWLPKGTYDVVFYLEGYSTLARQYSIYEGLIIDVEDRMAPGESTRPEDLVSRSTERRDARLRQDREQAAEVEARERAEGWRDRGRDERVQEDPDSDASSISDSDSARVILRVRPRDASVYLDGTFLGTAEDLGRLPSGFALEAGTHDLDVVRPGYSALRRVVRVEAGEAAELDLALEREPSEDDD